MMALAAGSFGDAAVLVEEAHALGQRVQPEMTLPVYEVQRCTLCDFRGTLEQIEPTLHGLVADYPARVVFRCLLAHVHARIGRRTDAARALDDLAVESFSVLPFDQEWLLGMSFLAETAAVVGDAGRAAVLYRLLLPWSALNIVDEAEAIRGSAGRYLGLLAATMERWDAAERHFEDAIAMNARMGVRPWLARTQHDYAHMLLARGGPGDRERATALLDLADAHLRRARHRRRLSRPAGARAAAPAGRAQAPGQLPIGAAARRRRSATTMPAPAPASASASATIDAKPKSNPPPSSRVTARAGTAAPVGADAREPNASA